MSQFDFDSILPKTGTANDAPRTIPLEMYEMIRMGCQNYPAYMTNQFNLHTSVPYAFFDLGGLRDATLLALEDRSHPRLEVEYRRALIHMASRIPEFDTFYAARRQQGMQTTRELLAQANQARLEADPNYLLGTDAERAAMRMHAMPRIEQIMAGNLSQQARNLQTDVWNRIQPSFLDFVCRAYDWATAYGWRFSLRMPIAMNMSRRDDLLGSSEMAGIAMVEAYQSATQNELMSRLFDAQVHTMLFRHLDLEDDTPARQNRKSFMFWDSIASYATAMSEGASVSLKPTHLPPWLMYSHDRFATYFLEEIPLGTYTECGVIHSDVDDPNFIPVVSLAYDPQKMAKILSVLAIGVSLWATQIRLGTGHRVPSWTSTPLNPTLLQWFVEQLANFRGDL